MKAFEDQIKLAGDGPYLFPSELNKLGYQRTFKTAWSATLRRAKVPHFRIYDLRSTYATRLSAGGIGDEWVTQVLRQGDDKVFKKYSQMQLQMKREALQKINRLARNGIVRGSVMVAILVQRSSSGTVLGQFSPPNRTPAIRVPLEIAVKSGILRVGA